MTRPEGMTPTTWAIIGRLRAELRNRVLERSCLIYYGGGASTLAEADELALAAEGILTQRSTEGGHGG